MGWLTNLFSDNKPAMGSRNQQFGNTITKAKPNDWMDSITYDSYNPAVEDRLRKEHRYLNLADYLSHFRMDNPYEQRNYDNEISQLRRYGRQYEAIHSHADEKQTFAIDFVSSFDSGNLKGLNENNIYKQEYDENISNLGKKRTHNWLYYGAKNIIGSLAPINPYSSIGATLATRLASANPTLEEGSSKYLTSEDEDDKEAATISVGFNDKHVRYSFWGLGPDILAKDTDENQFDKFCLETGYDRATLVDILGEGNVINKDGKTVLNIPKTNLEAIKLLGEIKSWCNDTGRTSDDINYASFDTNNELISDDTAGIGVQIQAMLDTINDAKKDQEDVMNNIGANNQINSITVLPYMNELQMQLKNAYDNFAIDYNTYNDRLKADNEVYERLLMGASFSQLEVYKAAEGTENFEFMEDPVERGNLKDYIRSAIDEDRVVWNAAIAGGTYGVYLTVAPKREKDDASYEGEDKDARKGQTFFIPGLFMESIQNAFNSSTDGKTVAEINSMQQYGYDYTLANGDVISRVNNNGATLYNKNTNTIETIDRDQLHDRIHESIIIEDAASQIRNKMYNFDGTMRTGYNPESDAKKIATVAVNEILGGQDLTPEDIWFTSKEAQDKFEREGNLDKDYKRSRALDIYRALILQISNLINTNR